MPGQSHNLVALLSDDLVRQLFHAVPFANDRAALAATCVRLRALFHASAQEMHRKFHLPPGFKPDESLFQRLDEVQGDGCQVRGFALEGASDRTHKPGPELRFDQVSRTLHQVQTLRFVRLARVSFAESMPPYSLRELNPPISVTLKSLHLEEVFDLSDADVESLGYWGSSLTSLTIAACWKVTKMILSLQHLEHLQIPGMLNLRVLVVFSRSLRVLDVSHGTLESLWTMRRGEDYSTAGDMTKPVMFGQALRYLDLSGNIVPSFEAGVPGLYAEGDETKSPVQSFLEAFPFLHQLEMNALVHSNSPSSITIPQKQLDRLVAQRVDGIPALTLMSGELRHLELTNWRDVRQLNLKSADFLEHYDVSSNVNLKRITLQDCTGRLPQSLKFFDISGCSVSLKSCELTSPRQSVP